MTAYGVPDGLPVLSRGKHRNARKGACFMEMASVLAAERWSDSPKCTHPLLAHLARMVNDASTDAHRSELAVLIPDVVGVRDDSLAFEVALTAAVAGRAVLDVPEELQRALAAGLLRCEQMVELLGPVVGAEEIGPALASVPSAAAWARDFAGDRTITPRQFRAFTAPTVARCAVRGLAVSSPDPDRALRDLLRTAITTARHAAGVSAETNYEGRWAGTTASASTASTAAPANR
jgi:hypothetical protein